MKRLSAQVISSLLCMAPLAAWVFDAVALSVFVGALSASPTSAADTQVFRDPHGEFSLRYPPMWDPVAPQRENTRILLYARDGSQGTCNVSVIAADASDIAAYDRQWAERNYPRIFSKVAVNLAEVRIIGLNRFAVIQLDHDFALASGAARVSEVIGHLLRAGKRYTILCNAPKAVFKSAQAAFEVISNMFLFEKL